MSTTALQASTKFASFASGAGLMLLIALRASIGLCAAPPTTGAEQSGTLEEVVVTAERRDERLLDVPLSVSVVNTQSLVASNETLLQNYYMQVPALSVAPGIQNTQLIAIRGITTGAQTDQLATVAVTIDDVPFTTTNLVPDLDPGDLARIEVLRGPQGTLYGSTGVGGVLKFVTNDPSTDRFSGRVEAGPSDVYSGSDLGYITRASANVPLADTLAVRLSGFIRQDPGYVDNPILGINGISRAHGEGGRVALLWRPSDSFSVRLSAIYQNISASGSSEVTTMDAVTGQQLGDLQQSFVRGVGPYDRSVGVYSAIIKARFGGVELTSLTGYNHTLSKSSLDETINLSFLAQNFGVKGVPDYERFDYDLFSQELRATAAISHKLDATVGVYYQHAVQQTNENLYATDPVTGAVASLILHDDLPSAWAEAAWFTTLAFHATDSLDFDVGVREHFQRNYGNNKVALYSGYFASTIFGADPFLAPITTPHVPNAFTYLADAKWKISKDLMTYARFSTGYQPGATDANGGRPGIPNNLAPAKTYNYEVGMKGMLFNDALSFEGAVYYIDWKDIQLSLVSPYDHAAYDANGGTAKSEGAELSAQWVPLKGMTVAGWVAYNEAVMTNLAGLSANIYIAPGDRLPYSARWSSNLSVDQDFPLTDALSMFAGGTVAFIGDREGLFNTAPERQYYPEYFKTDIHAGFHYNQWTTNFYVTNLTDRRGVLAGGLGNVVPYSFYILQPRTVGFTVWRNF